MYSNCYSFILILDEENLKDSFFLHYYGVRTLTLEAAWRFSFQLFCGYFTRHGVAKPSPSCFVGDQPRDTEQASPCICPKLIPLASKNVDVNLDEPGQKTCSVAFPNWVTILLFF